MSEVTPTAVSTPAESVATETTSSTGSILGSFSNSASEQATPSTDTSLYAGKYKSVDDLVSGYKNLEQQLGKRQSGVQLPNENSTPDEVNNFWKQLGKPEAADKYEINLPEGIDGDEGLINSFKEFAYENNIPSSLAQKLVDYQASLNAKAYEASIEQWNKKIEKTRQELKNEYGAGFERHCSNAYKALVQFAGEQQAKQMLDTYGNDASFIKMMVNVASAIGEDKVGMPTSQTGLMNVDTAKREREAILKDKNHPLNSAYWNGRDANHRNAVDELNRLTRIAFGEV